MFEGSLKTSIGGKAFDVDDGDATLLHVPSSTKNAIGKQEPDKHPTCRGRQWYFGLSAKMGADYKHGTMYWVSSTAVSVGQVHAGPIGA